jgi:hypothetical protein
VERFQLMLHCEQFQEQRDVRHFDMAGVELRLEPSSGLLVLEVAGLQEGRPRVLRGDKLYLREASSNRMVEYEAFVHQVGRVLRRPLAGPRWERPRCGSAAATVWWPS